MKKIFSGKILGPSVRGMACFVRLYGGHKKDFFLMTVLFIIKSSCVWLSPVIVGEMVDIVTRGDADGYHRLLGLSGLQMLLLIANYPAALLTTNYQSGVSRSVGRMTRLHLVRDLHNRAEGLGGQLMGGDFYAKATRDIEMIEQWPRIYLNNIVATILAVGVTAYSMMDRAPLALLCFFVLIPLSFVLQRYFQRRLQNLTNLYREKFAAMGSSLEDTSRMRFLTKAHGIEAFAIQAVTPKFDAVRETGRQLDMLSESFSATNFISFTAVHNVFFAICLYVALGKNLSLGEVLMFSSFFGSVSGSVMGLVGVIPSLALIFESAKSLEPSLSVSPSCQETLDKADLPFAGHIEFKGVTFHYPKSPHVALHQVTFSIQRGEILGILGPSGSGKSTLLSLVFGSLAPTSGKILIDGQDSSLLRPQSLRRKIGVVPQEVLLFSGTIMENVAYGFPEASDGDVIEALKLAQAWDFVSVLKDQIHTRLADDGVRLSGGQKQRLALARALIRKPSLLLLDEATSAVDPETERQLTKTIQSLSPGRMIVIISHRMESVKFCDKILTLESGRATIRRASQDRLQRLSSRVDEGSEGSLSSALRS